MDHAVGDQNVGLDHTSVVDVDRSTLKSHGDVSTVESLQRAAVHDVGAVERWAASNNVVLEDGGDLLGGQVGQVGSDSLEGGVVGDKHGQIGG